tara:strand:+ start:285 stop:1769 length:1485 start_codon:yes stop_codon:yes gene_type:complete
MAINKLQQNLNKLKAAPVSTPDKPENQGNEYYNQYQTEGTTFINPTFGQPNTPNKSNMGQLGAPSSRFKAQVTKDTMKGLQNYSNKSAAPNDMLSDINNAIAGREATDFRNRSQVAEGNLVDANIGGNVPTSYLRPEMTGVGEIAGTAVSPAISAGAAVGRETFLRPASRYLNFPGSRNLRLSTSPGIGPAARTGFMSGLRSAPNMLVRGTPIMSAGVDTFIRAQDIYRTHEILNERQQRFDELSSAAQEQILAQDPNYLNGDDLFQQVRMSRGGALIDEFDNAGVLGKTLQGMGLVAAPYQLFAMGEAPNYEMQQALSDAGELASRDPSALTSQLYGGRFADTIPESSRFDFSQATPEARDAAMRLVRDAESRNELTGFYGNLAKAFLSRPEGAERDLTQYLQGAVAEGQITPAQLSTLFSRVGINRDADQFYDRNMTEKSDSYEARRAEQERVRDEARAQRARDVTDSRALRGSNSLGMSTPMGTGRPSVQQ